MDMSIILKLNDAWRSVVLATNDMVGITKTILEQFDPHIFCSSLVAIKSAFGNLFAGQVPVYVF